VTAWREYASPSPQRGRGPALLKAYCSLHVTFIAWHTFKIPCTTRSVAELSPGLVAAATRICEILVPRSLTVMLAERRPLLNSTVRPLGSSITICSVWFLRSRLTYRRVCSGGIGVEYDRRDVKAWLISLRFLASTTLGGRSPGRIRPRGMYASPHGIRACWR
jgi:hypothetical protein